MPDQDDRGGDIYISDHGTDHGHTDFDHDSGVDHSVGHSDGFHVSYDTGSEPGGTHLQLTDHGDGRIYD